MANQSPSHALERPTSQKLNVVVRGAGQRDTMLALTQWDTVGSVFKELRRRRLIPQSSRVRFVLYFDQHRHGPLLDHEALGDIGVCSLSVLHLRASLPGGTGSNTKTQVNENGTICAASKSSEIPQPGSSTRAMESSPLCSRFRFISAFRGKENNYWLEKQGKYPAAFGGASDVWKGKLTADGEEGSIAVALKYQRAIRSNGNWSHEHLDHETRCWRRLDHEHVAPLYGVYLQSDGPSAIIMPWYGNGTADTYLRTHPDADPIQIIQELAAAVEHLHEMGVVHGDLKATNIVIDDEGHVKLIDFGSSQLNTELAPSPSLTSIRWCPRELLLTDMTVTKASDVYSFASTALELLTGRVPYDALRERYVPLTIINGVTPRHLSSGSRYIVPRSVELWGLLDRCWAESDLRPSIGEVRLCLQDLYS